MARLFRKQISRPTWAQDSGNSSGASVELAGQTLQDRLSYGG